MMNTNKSILVGRLVKDPESRQTPSGTAVANFTIAVNRMKKQGATQSEADFFDIVAWQKTAEIAVQYLKKCSQVIVVGRLEQQKWEKDGQKRSKVVINAEQIEFIGGKPSDASASDGNQADDTFPDMPADAEIPF